MNGNSSDIARSTVLIVEDSRAIASELKRKVETNVGLSAEFVTTYADAELFLSEFSQEVFLAILDLNLPDSRDGAVVDLFCSKGIPSIIFTADLDDSMRQMMLSKDVIDYVIKDIHAIPNIIRYIKRLKRNCNIGVLVVDDSESFRFSLNRMLRKQMFRVMEASDGETAIKLMKNDADISLVITDYEMPGINGVEVVKELRSMFSREQLAIVGISSSGEPMLTAKFIKSGANDFLYKPFEMEEFYCRIGSVVENLELIKKLQEVNRVKNQFLGMAAHDLRSPISGINGFTKLMLDGLCGNLTDDQKEIVEVMNSAAGQMNALVNDLLDISAIDSGQLRLDMMECDPALLIKRRLKLHSMSAKQKSITFRVKLENVGKVLLDERRIGQVLDNLITNAIKFSHAGTFVDIILEKKGEDLCFRVKDNGQGVPEEEICLLFQSFAKTRVQPTAGESSTGLGLHIVKKIVESHFGSVGVESEFGKGAEFYFTLPANSS